MSEVVTKEGAGAVLAAAGFHDQDEQTIADVASVLDAAAHAFITDYYLNRLDDKGRLRRLPRKESRHRLYGDLEGAWIDLPGIKETPTVIYGKGRYSGNYVLFVQTFAGIVADHIEKQTPGQEWEGLIGTLRRLQGGGARSNPVSQSFKRIAGEIRNNEAKEYRDSLPPWARMLAK